MSMSLPLFSAAYANRLQILTDRESDSEGSEKKTSAPRWRRGQDGEEKSQWGFILELPSTPQVGEGEVQNSNTMTARDHNSTDPRSKVRTRGTHSPSNRYMAIKTHTWISLWFLLSAPVVLWDASYCFMRPRSMAGGDLHWIWKPYELYQDVDFIYGVKALQEGNGFTNAQSLLNVIETIMNLTYVYLAHVAAWPPATLLGFASVVMTLSKTVLYWMQEYYCNYCSVGHNNLQDLILMWIIPNGIWLVVPSFILVQFWKDLTGSVLTADRASKKTKSGKAQ